MRFIQSIVLAVLAYQACHRAAPPAVVVIAPPPVVVTQPAPPPLEVLTVRKCPCMAMNRICTLGLDPPECVEAVHAWQPR